ncbi:MAG TPA: cupin domain-containing protein [Acidobacteriota bacterium]|nr:cupin domain-containing protein [Acidobacteriota bacterium]
MTKRRWICIVALALMMQWAMGQGNQSQQEKASSRGEGWQAFEWKGLMEDAARTGSPWHPFLTQPTLSMGVYRLPAGSDDGQSPHEKDEVYYVAQGQAVLRVGEDDIPVSPGSVLYVRAGADHHFHSIAEDLVVLVFFSAAEPPQAPRPRGSNDH